MCKEVVQKLRQALADAEREKREMAKLSLSTRCCGNCVKYVFSLISDLQICSISSAPNPANAVCKKHVPNRFSHVAYTKATAIIERQPKEGGE
jgi:hypothetical protein